MPKEKVLEEMKKCSRTRFEAGLDDSFLHPIDSGDAEMRKLFTYKIDSAPEDVKRKQEEGVAEKNLFSLPLIYKTKDGESSESQQMTSQ